MSRVNSFIQGVLRIAGLPPDHELGEELRTHLDQLVAEHEQVGLPHEQAVERALMEFGDAKTIGSRVREVTPLRISRRDWLIMVAGCLITALGSWVGSVYLRNDWIGLYGDDWFLFVPLMGAAMAALVRHPVIGAMAPAAGIYMARVLVETFKLYSPPILDTGIRLWSALPVDVLGPTHWPAGRVVEAGVMVVVCALAGWAVARLRRIDPSVPFTKERLVAGASHLAPLLVMVGLSWAALATLLLSALWYKAKDRSPFVTRHSLQAAVVTAGAVVSQVLAHQVSGRMTPGLWPPLVLAVSLMPLRRIFGALAVWAAVSALTGHDYRYPFAGWLFGGSKWRKLKHV